MIGNSKYGKRDARRGVPTSTGEAASPERPNLVPKGPWKLARHPVPGLATKSHSVLKGRRKLLPLPVISINRNTQISCHISNRK